MLQIAYRRVLIAEPGASILVSLKAPSGPYRRCDNPAQFRVFRDNRRHLFTGNVRGLRRMGKIGGDLQKDSGMRNQSLLRSLRLRDWFVHARDHSTSASKISDQQSAIRNLEHRSENILINGLCNSVLPL